jgi:hypothetical protein
LLRIHDSLTSGALTLRKASLKYREIPAKQSPSVLAELSVFMSPKSPAPPQSSNKKQPCKHPRVQVVGRDEESEFVECKECGEVFESSEFKDMNIEENIQESEI